MTKTIKFEPRTYGKLTNALSLRLHEDAYSAITKSGISPDTMNITATELDDYNKDIRVLADITKEAEASADTKKLNSLDADRDKTVTHVFNVIRAYVDSPFGAEVDAAEKLLIHVNKYKGLQREAALEESTHIDSFILDIRKLQTHLNTLHLEPAINTLEEQNNDFKTLYTARRQEQTATALPPAKEVRTQLDTLLDDMLNSISASYLLSRNDDTKQRLLALATELNSIFKDIKRVANQKAGQKKIKG